MFYTYVLLTLYNIINSLNKYTSKQINFKSIKQTNYNIHLYSKVLYYKML